MSAAITILAPALQPCVSCPYRTDVPSGVWAEAEYAKLPAYDRATMDQPLAPFLCHQRNRRLCSGWVGCHDMNQSLGLRAAVSMGALSIDDCEACLDYVSPVPLFASGAEAAAHGLRDMAAPGDRAQQVMAKIAKRNGRTTS